MAANRDELHGRPASPPGPWQGEEALIAGRDLVAGGTWLGCRNDGSGRVVGVLNRRPQAHRAGSGPGELSRGSLCRDFLGSDPLDTSLSRLDAGHAARFGGFNLFAADLKTAFVLDNGAGLRRVDLGPGLSVLTNLDVNDPRCPRLAGATRRFEALSGLLASGMGAEEALPRLASVLASHEDGEEAGADGAGNALSRTCVHAGEYGTRSSTILFVSGSGEIRYFHADGPPCVTPFLEVATGAS